MVSFAMPDTLCKFRPQRRCRIGATCVCNIVAVYQTKVLFPLPPMKQREKYFGLAVLSAVVADNDRYALEIMAAN